MKHQKLFFIGLLTILLSIGFLSNTKAQSVKGRPPGLVNRKQAALDSLRRIQLQLEEKKIVTAKRLYKTEKYAKSFLLLKRYCRSEVFDTQAKYYLGMCYLKPLNTRLPNPTKAILYLKEAAKDRKLMAESSTALGQLYMTGSKSLQPDINRAMLYLKKADAARAVQATYLLGQLMFYGTGGAVADETKGIQYLEKAANAGLTDAQWTLATIYTQGTPTFPKDMKQAKIWYQKVAVTRQNKFNNNY
jgi:TPR repeat protein